MDIDLAILAWPGAFLLGAIAGMLIFRRQLGAAIDRIRRIGRDGAELGPSQTRSPGDQQRNAEISASETQAATLPVPAAQALPPPHAVLAPIEQDIETALANAKASPEVNRAWLIRALATTRQMLDHERTYRLIVGSQLQMILEANTGVPVELSRADDIYGQA